MPTYLLFFATKFFHNKPYMCIFTNTNFLVLLTLICPKRSIKKTWVTLMVCSSSQQYPEWVSVELHLMEELELSSIWSKNVNILEPTFHD